MIRPPAVRLAAYYGATFAFVGVQMPFWPVWLRAQGLSASEIGLLLAAGLWVKVISNPLIAQAADRRGARKAFLVGLSVVLLAAYCAFSVVGGFVALLIVSIVASTANSAMMPLGEATTMAAVSRQGLDYGRIRLWGSVTFILASIGAGHLLGGRPVDLVLWLIIALLVLLVGACLALPASRDAPAAYARSVIPALLRNRVFLLFVFAASLIQASHAVLYGFATLHWQAQGISDGMIGWLWAEGVLAEIVLFSVSGWIVRRLGITNLLLLAAACGALRWAVMGVDARLPVMVAAQALHGVTFGATHLATMHFIARAVPAGITATAQGLYGAVGSGIVMGLAMGSAGLLYDALAGAAFYVMIAPALIAAFCAVALRRRWDGGVILG